MKFASKPALAMIGLSMVSSLWAAPTIYPLDPSLITQVQNTTNSDIVADSVDPNLFYVFPPKTGSSEVGSLHSLTAYVGFCGEMKDLKDYSRAAMARLVELQNKEYDSKEVMDQIQLRLDSAREDAAKYVVENNLTELSDLDGRISQIELEMNVLNDKLRECTQETCEELRSQLRLFKHEKSQAVIRRSQLAREHTRAMTAYNRKVALVKSIEQQLDNHTENWRKIQKRVMEAGDLYSKMFDRFAELEGGWATLTFSNAWDENIKTLRTQNGGKFFQKIETKNAVFFSSIPGTKDLPGKSSIMSLHLPGRTIQGELKLDAYPENMVGSLRMSLLGVCPMLHPQDFGVDFAGEKEKLKVGLTATFEYPSVFTAKAVAKYNMHRIYEKIVKSKTKGGFFRSKKFNTITEREFFKDSFKVEWIEQDDAVALSPEEKDHKEQEWRHQIFSRLAATSMAGSPNPGTLILPEAGQTGAAVLGRSLANNKQCQMNKYCAAATIGVNVLDAIFGKVETTTSYTNIQDKELVEEWSQTKSVYRPYIISYK